MQFSVPCEALHVLPGLCASVAPRPAAVAAGPVASWHLRLPYRTRAPGLKSTMGKCPVDF